MRDSIGTATTARARPSAAGRSSTTASSAGSRLAAFSHGASAALVEQRGIAAKLVDQEPADPPAVGVVQHRMRAHQRRDHMPAVDVAHQGHRHVGRMCEAHVGDVAHAQVRLRRTARTFHQHQVGLRGQ
jgi:hypothetical protein